MVASAVHSRGLFLCLIGESEQGPSGPRDQQPLLAKGSSSSSRTHKLNPEIGVYDVASGCDDFSTKGPLGGFSWETLCCLIMNSVRKW